MISSILAGELEDFWVFGCGYLIGPYQYHCSAPASSITLSTGYLTKFLLGVSSLRINVNVESTSDSVIDLLANPGFTAYSSLFCLTLLRLVDIRHLKGNVLVVLSV